MVLKSIFSNVYIDNANSLDNEPGGMFDVIVDVNTKRANMRVVVTEAASKLAYHLVQHLASGDVIQNQTIDLILCDNVDKQDTLIGVAYELQDCVYPALSSVETTNDLCESFKTADVALILPRSRDEHVPKDVQIDFTDLKQIDFQVLDGVFHPAGIMTQDSCRFTSKGVMSTALSIANSLQQYHYKCLQEDDQSRSMITYPEEAEYGLADYTQNDGDISPWLGLVTQERRVLLMHVMSDNSVVVEDKNEQKQDITELENHAFLSRL